MGNQKPESILIEDFTDALEEFPLFELSDYKNDAVSKQLNTSKVFPDDSTIKTYKFLRKNEKFNRLTEETNSNSSVITSDERVSTVNSPNPGSNFLFTVAGLVIKTIEFQTSLLLGLVSFPIWILYSSYIFLIDPFAIIRHGIKTSISRLLRLGYGNLKGFLNLWIKRNKSTWQFCMQIGWGLLSSAFVGIILFGLLIMGFLVSGAIMKCILEKPVMRIERLNFDYTRDTPMAFIPIISCSEPLCLDCNEKIESGGVIPLDHKLRATVSLTLPESDYNRNLGIFQVRVDFLSSNGKPLLTAIQPSMLQFKSKPIRFLLTIFRLAPIMTGYSSESQTLNIKFNGHTETKVPTSCLRVVMEPRAQFSNVGGVPEIYTAYLKLESQLPLLKRILWSWKATVFVWITIVIFTVGLLLTMPIIAPWIWPSSQNSRSG